MTTTGLQLVEAKVNGSMVQALVYTRATHNFISKDKVERFGIQVAKGMGSMKAANLKAKPILGITRDIRLRIGEWKGTIDFLVISMDDFKLLLRLDFQTW